MSRTRRQVVSPRLQTGRSHHWGPSSQHCGEGAGGEWRSAPEGDIFPCCHHYVGRKGAAPCCDQVGGGGWGARLCSQRVTPSLPKACFHGPLQRVREGRHGPGPFRRLADSPGVRRLASRRTFSRVRLESIPGCLRQCPQRGAAVRT